MILHLGQKPSFPSLQGRFIGIDFGVRMIRLRFAGAGLIVDRDQILAHDLINSGISRKGTIVTLRAASVFGRTTKRAIWISFTSAACGVICTITRVVFRDTTSVVCRAQSNRRSCMVIVLGKDMSGMGTSLSQLRIYVCRPMLSVPYPVYLAEITDSTYMCLSSITSSFPVGLMKRSC